MQNHYEWLDYNLNGPPAISFDDYTFRSFGCQRLFDNYLTKIKKIRSKGLSIRWLILDFWGRGKSTFMYNLCYETNNCLFFNNPGESLVLALFVNRPQNPEDLLDYSYQNGLPIPWNLSESKEEVIFSRKALFSKALRILVFSILRKAIESHSFNSSQEKKLLSLGLPVEQIILPDFLKTVDNLENNEILEVLEQIVDRFLQTLIKEEKCRLAGYETLYFLGGLIYPQNSIRFVSSLGNLLREPKKGLRNFLNFHALCNIAEIHLLLVIDEAAEWMQVSKFHLDDFLAVSLKFNRLSAIVISRADVERSLKGRKRFSYYYLRSFLKTLELSDPLPSDVLEMAKGVLATNRKEHSFSIYPFSESFIISLSQLTNRSGHFNSRMFVRGLSIALRLSLRWERPSIEITRNFIKMPELLDNLSENLKMEDQKGLQLIGINEKAEEIERKIMVADYLAKLLFSGAINPATTYMLDIANTILAESFQISKLSEIELLAYNPKNVRMKLSELIDNLRQVQLPIEAKEYLNYWMKNQIDFLMKNQPSNKEDNDSSLY